MAASPKVATYDLQPEMLHQSWQTKPDALTFWQPDFLCLNFANPDMVGHTGVFEAVVKAVETTDACLRRVVECAKSIGYAVVVIADHGNIWQGMPMDHPYGPHDQPSSHLGSLQPM